MWVCLWNIVAEHSFSFRVTVNVLRKRFDLLSNCSRLVIGQTKTCIFMNQSNETKVSRLFTSKSVPALSPFIHYIRWIWKHCFILTFRPTVFTNPGKLSTENGWIVDEYDFNLKYLLCVLVSMENFLHNVTFWKRWRLQQRCVSRFIDISLHVLGKSVDEKHFMCQCARGVS